MRADVHPDARPLGPWGTEPLYCLNTDTHHIPIGGYVFMDYDETAEADEEAMQRVESHVNGGLYRASCPPILFSRGAPLAWLLRPRPVFDWLQESVKPPPSSDGAIDCLPVLPSPA